MDSQTIEITIRTYLTEMRSHLEKAASIAKAAEACANSGNVEKPSRSRSTSSRSSMR